MLGTTAGTGTRSPTGFLRPGLALARLGRKNGLVVQTQTTRWRRLGRAGDLIRTHFPEKPVVRANGWMPEWLAILNQFLIYVEEAGWFEWDYDILNEFYEMAQNDSPPLEEVDGPDWWEPAGLAECAQPLDIIPVRTFGFTIDDWSWKGDIGRHPPLALLDGLLGEGQWLFSEADLDFSIFDKLPPITSAKDRWRRLNTLDTTSLSEPLCWLPEMARYACGQTGNIIMDTPRTDINWMTDWYHWDNPTDLAFIRQQWAETKVIRGRIQMFLEWCEGEEQLEIILKLVEK